MVGTNGERCRCPFMRLGYCEPAQSPNSNSCKSCGLDPPKGRSVGLMMQSGWQPWILPVLTNVATESAISFQGWPQCLF
eukprot:4616840-Alexandrium_andersonii.AAC.1